MSSFLDIDVRTVVLRTLSKRLTPVMMRYALVAKEVMSWLRTRVINYFYLLSLLKMEAMFLYPYLTEWWLKLKCSKI